MGKIYGFLINKKDFDIFRNVVGLRYRIHIDLTSYELLESNHNSSDFPIALSKCYIT